MKPLLYTGIFFLSLSLFAMHTSAGGFTVGPAPKIEIVEYTVILSTEMAVALKKYDPEFEIWEAWDFDHLFQEMYSYGGSSGKYIINYQAPSAVIGDFNGDKIPDIALLGHNKTHEKRIVVLSEPAGYEVVELFNYPLSVSLSPTAKKGRISMGKCIELVPVGRRIKAEPAFNRPELNLKTDAFEYGGERGSSLFYYKNGKFIEYCLSD